MAKAHIAMPDGVNVKLDGTPAEIAAVLKEVRGEEKPGTTRRQPKKRGKTNKVTLPGLFEELRTEGFLKKARTLADIRKRLADLGHNYPRTALSGPLRTEVRKRRLRRFKENKKYVYAQ
jgi:hypothetical protein